MTENLHRDQATTSIQERPNWSAVQDCHIIGYQECLWELFANAKLPCHLAECDISCDYHRVEIDRYLKEVTDMLHAATNRCIPFRKIYKNKRGEIAGWNELVRPYQTAARQSFKFWADAGRPTSGALYESMKADKRNYKYAVRRIKSRSSEAQLDTLGCNLLEGSYAQFWKSVQKLKSSRGLRAHTISGSSTEFGIARMWRDHFARIHDTDNIGRSHQQRECLHRVYL